jgi:hypothetical protein
MLRWLMSWCVPARALRFHTNFSDVPGHSDGSSPADLAPIGQNA